MVDLILAGVVLVLVGIGVIAISLVKSRAHVRGGGVVMVGPIPIIFGSDARWASLAIVLAMVLVLLTLLLGVV